MGSSANAKEGIKIIELEEEEGEHVETTDYFFDKIGKPIPILKHHTSPLFQAESPPCRPLALSEQHRLIFVAHSSGFFAARTKDVMDAAKDLKAKGTASSIQELCFVDVPIGKVHILALSADASTLAVSVAAHIHFFPVNSLINRQELKPSVSCSLSHPNTVKDMQWRKTSDTSYLVLSDHGNLYHATCPGPLKHLMDNVEAVEWSVQGKFIAVARQNILSIFSSKFQEKLRISLPLKSWIGDSHDNCIVKVDSIRWVRFDSIVIGCFQQTADGKEESYLLQVIRSKDGKITDASSKPVVSSFYDLFLGLIDDIVPYASGPHLFLSYLEQCGLAVTANRKNTDQHIVLLGWAVEDKMSENAVVDIERDTWLPRIELQDNGDDNLIMGLCVDNVSLYEKVKVEIGVEEQKELSPHCVLMCVTLEGKLVMFHVASVSGATPEVNSVLHDEEEDAPAEVLEEIDRSNLSSGLAEQTLGQASLDLQLQDVSKKEPNINEGGEIPTKRDLHSSKNESSTIVLATEPKNQEVGFLANFKSFVADGQQHIPATKLYHDIDGQQKQLFGQQSAKLGQSSLSTSLVDGPSKTETRKFAGFGSGAAYFSREVPTDACSQSSHKDVPKNVELAKESPGKIGSTVLQGVPSQSWSRGKAMFSEGTESRSPFLPSTLIQGSRSDKDSISIDAANVPSDFAGKPFHLRENAGESTAAKFSVRPGTVVGLRPSIGVGTIELLPSIRTSQLSSQENFPLGRSPNHQPFSLKDDCKTQFSSNSQPNLSKQFGNIKEIVKELDTLLECIEETGGFRDACTVLQRSSVENLEDGMETLSEKCRMWKSLMAERLGEIQHLLDKTVQVLARKIYLDDIVKQAFDSRYWELWNCQKLSSELELKRRFILKLNLDLTNQLIELERHFNIIEFHRFGESGGVHAGGRAFQSRHVPSRYIQSLHSLQNTMSSQLAAAEQLSECLSRQMSVLSIESPLKQKNVKRELFETIGIPYDASFGSPGATKVDDSPPLKELLLSCGSATAKDQSRRRQSSAMKSSDSETARRRRESLDQSWASFEPTKTTVKRVLLQESQKASVNKSSLLINKQHFDSWMVDRSAEVTHSQDQTSSSKFLYPSGNKGFQSTFSKRSFEKNSPFKEANNSLLQSQPTGLRSPMSQSSNGASSSVSLPQVSHMARQNVVRETCNMAAGGSSNSVSYVEKPDSALIKEIKSIQQTEASLHQKSSVFTMLPTQTALLLKKSSEIPNSNTRGTVHTTTIESVKLEPTSAQSSIFESPSKNYDSSFSPLAASPAAPTLPGKDSQFNIAISKSQPSEKVSSFPSFSRSLSVSSSPMINSSLNTPSSLSVPSSTVLTPSAAMPFGMSLTGSQATIDASHAVSSTSFSSLSPSPVFPSSASFSLEAPKMLPSSNTPASISESPKIECQPLAGNVPLSVNSILPSLSPVPSLMSESLKTELQPFASKTPPVNPISLMSNTPKTELQHPTDEVSSKKNVDAATAAPHSQPEPSVFSLKLGPSVSFVPTTEISTGLASGSTFSLKLESSVSSVPATEISTGLASGSQPFLKLSSPASNVALDAQTQPSSHEHVPLAPQISVYGIAGGGKNGSLDVTVTDEDEMEEEAPETSNMNELGLGNLGGFGIGSTPSPTAPRANPFGGPYGNIGTNQASSSFSMTVPGGELFRPASFNFQSPQAAQPSPTNLGAFSGGFGTGTITHASSQSQFGQPAQIGPGQQALGSVLGAFGQNRQLGTGLPGNVFASSSGFGGGFASTRPTGGFSSAATGGGFAGVASTGGGFAGLASGGGGFAGVASVGGGFAGAASGGGVFGSMASPGGGFAAATSAGGGFSRAAGGFGAAGGGFGAFGSQQGAGAFSGFSGNSTGGNGKPPELFTQMRK